MVLIKDLSVINLIEMKTPNRDLLVLLKDDHQNNLSIEMELEQLNEILFLTETVDNYCIVTEVMDLNKYMIVDDRKKLARLLQKPSLKPFQFIFNKN